MGLFDIFRKPDGASLDAGSGELSASPSRSSHPRRSHGHSAARMLMMSADTGRLTGDWPTQPVPADWIISRYQRTLVARSREQAHNNDFMRAFLRHVRQNIVGKAGILLQSTVEDEDARAAILEAWNDWGLRDNCDVAGKLSWRQVQNCGTETAARDGEFMFRIITGRKHGGKYGFALQELDPQRCPVDFDRADSPTGNFIRHGIEFTEYGKAVAYYFADTSSNRGQAAYSYGGRSYKRIPAEEIIHGFIPELPGQKRGLPWMTTGLFRAKQMSAMEDAAVVNARVGSAKVGVVKYEPGYGPEPEEDQSFDAEPGSLLQLPDGASLDKWDPLYPNGEFAPFIKQMLRGFSASGGVGYHSISGDLEGVNFSSIRHGTLDERESHMDRQEWLIDELCRRVFLAWLPFAILTGNIRTKSGDRLDASRLAELKTHSWQARRWQWIDPRADSAAAETEKNNLLKSPAQQIRESGRDPSAVWKETGENIMQMKAAGIPDEVIAISFGQKPTPGAPEQSEKTAS